MRAANRQRPRNRLPADRATPPDRATAGEGSADGRAGDEPAAFRSVLFGEMDADPELARTPEPECFGDLNLDQLVGAITARERSHDLAPFFHTPLQGIDLIRYHEWGERGPSRMRVWIPAHHSGDRPFDRPPAHS